MNSLPKIVTQQRRDYDLNPGPSAPESSTLTMQCVEVFQLACETHVQSVLAVEFAGVH